MANIMMMMNTITTIKFKFFVFLYYLAGISKKIVMFNNNLQTIKAHFGIFLFVNKQNI